MGRSKLSNYDPVSVTKLGGADEEHVVNGSVGNNPPASSPILDSSADEEFDCCEGDETCSGTAVPNVDNANESESEAEEVPEEKMPDDRTRINGSTPPPYGPYGLQGGAPRSRRPSYASTTSSSSMSSSGSSTSSSSDDDDDNMSQASTTELLGGDPLFLVLSQFFMTNSGRSIADILDDISVSLRKLAKAAK